MAYGYKSFWYTCLVCTYLDLLWCWVLLMTWSVMANKFLIYYSMVFFLHNQSDLDCTVHCHCYWANQPISITFLKIFLVNCMTDWTSYLKPVWQTSITVKTRSALYFTLLKKKTATCIFDIMYFFGLINFSACKEIMEWIDTWFSNNYCQSLSIYD